MNYKKTPVDDLHFQSWHSRQQETPQYIEESKQTTLVTTYMKLLYIEYNCEFNILYGNNVYKRLSS